MDIADNFERAGPRREVLPGKPLSFTPAPLKATVSSAVRPVMTRGGGGGLAGGPGRPAVGVGRSARRRTSQEVNQGKGGGAATGTIRRPQATS